MRRKTRLSTLACVLALVLLCAVTAAIAGDQRNPKAGAAGKEPYSLQNQESKGIGNYHGTPQQIQPDPNSNCMEAEEITVLIGLGMPGHPLPPPTEWNPSVQNRRFSNGRNVDDWYKYTTHDTCTTSSGTPSLDLTLTSDKPQVEVELYEECGAWAVATSMWREEGFSMDEDVPAEPAGWEFSGLVKTLGIDCQENHTYYIHVNCLRPPDDRGTIKYTLQLHEYCKQPAA
jgi:hypothetical protein